MVVEIVLGEMLLWLIFEVLEEVVVIGIVRFILGMFMGNVNWERGF